MKKNLYLTKNNIYPNLLKSEEIKVYFVVFSTNKSVENLIFVLNKLLFNYKLETVEKLNKMIFFSVSIPIKNYFILKEVLNFKTKEESFKFEFVSVKFKNNNFSINFFEQNFLKNDIKQEFFEDFTYFIYLNFLVNKHFLIKLFLIIISIYIKFLNNLKNIGLEKI